MILATSSAAISATLITYGYWAIFPIAVIEGPIIAIVAGFFVASGHLNGLVVVSTLVVADLIGDTLYYALGRYGGRKAIAKWGPYVGVSEHRVLRFKKIFDRHDWKILFFGKTNAAGSVILAAAGVAEMPFLRFMGWNTIASLPKVLFFVGVGYFIGDSYTKAETYLTYSGIISTVVAIAALIIWAIVGGYVSKRAMSNGEETSERPQSNTNAASDQEVS